ncbi:MAG TPA: flavodoxin family protein [Methanobacterium sp.]
MKIMVITSSPNNEGLTESCGAAAKKGIEKGKCEAIMVRLNDLNILKCKACDQGWGICLESDKCILEDDFEKVHEAMGEVDGFVVVTPVYFHDMSESAKTFFDRLRRCEANIKFNREKINKIEKKPVICVAAAGGMGTGTVPCLTSMERLFFHLNKLDYSNLTKFDYFGVTQRNKEYMLNAIEASAYKTVQGE